MECKVIINRREWNARMIRYIAYVAHKVIIYETLTITRLSNSTSYASYPHRRDESGSCQASYRGVEAL
ncbi:hypothetical protein GQ600_4987 [Phytophthora cactorum]|nr:hypothetical protein GQ600_4987 [Phytophthora cactorum]